MKTNPSFKSAEGKKAILSLYNGILSAFPYEQKTVKTRFGETFLLACGEADAPPLVLLHGAAFNSMMWLGDAQVFLRTHRVYMLDIPGEPGNSGDVQHSLRGGSHAQWLRDVFAALSIEKADLVGISLGGFFAAEFASRYPEMVNRLVLLCPAGFSPVRLSFDIATKLQKFSSRKKMTKTYDQVNGQALPDPILRFQALLVEHFNYRRDPIPLFTRAQLARLTMPVKIILGGKDVIFDSEKTQRRARRCVAGASIHMLPEEGHTLINLSGEIAAFLNAAAG